MTAVGALTGVTGGPGAGNGVRVFIGSIIDALAGGCAVGTGAADFGAVVEDDAVDEVETGGSEPICTDVGVFVRVDTTVRVGSRAGVGVGPCPGVGVWVVNEAVG